jgi:hypothetical protein
MKNLNIIVKKATMPNPVTSVNRKFLYSFCAVLLLLTCSLLTSAKGAKFGHYKANPYTLTSLGLGAVESFGKSLLVTSSGDDSGHDAANADASVVFYHRVSDWYYENSFYNDAYGLTNNLGASNSGNDRWIKLTIPTGVTGTLEVRTGTVSNSTGYDSALHLVDSGGTYELTYNDDDTSVGTPGWVGATIYYTVSPGVYYLVLDGTDKPYVYPNPSPVRNGGVNITMSIH